MRRQDALLLLLGTFLIILFLLMFFLRVITPRYVRSVEAHVQVADFVGINVDNDQLYFGANTPGGGAKRDIMINSGEDSFVIMSQEGELSEWLWPSENRFLIVGGEEKPVTMHLRIPEETPYGNYTGRVTATFYRPVARLLLG